MEWKKIDKSGEFEAKEQGQFLLMDIFHFIYFGYTAFDYYDAEYWCALPKMPMSATVITNDACIVGLLKDK